MPTSFDPVRWDPPAAPFTGRTESGPFPPTRVIPLPGHGPEDVVVDAHGRLLCGLADGRVVRVEPRSGVVETVGDTGGRPIGLEVAPDGSVVVCDVVRGLLRLDPSTGAVETLVAEVEGSPLVFCSNAAAGADGTVYFTESSSRHDLDHYRDDLLEHRGSGRLFAHHPDGRTKVLLRGLHFANGVSVTADGSALMVAETGAYCVSRVELTGPRAGQRRVVIENLAGFPDNISRSPDGLTWVAMAAPRNAVLDGLSRRPAWIRRAIRHVPQRLQPAAERCVWAIAIDDAGTIVHDLRTQRDDYHFVTGVVEHEGHLYLSSLEESAILDVDLGRGPSPTGRAPA